jgi:uncharacterized protein DUF1192
VRFCCRYNERSRKREGKRGDDDRGRRPGGAQSADLEEYIAALEAEADRARAEIAAKQKQRTGAEALFKR